MSDWDKTRNGKEMMETIIRYLPRITVCLEEIAKELGKHDEFGRSEGEKRILRFLKDNKKATTESKKILYTEIKDTKMSYVLTEDVAKIGKRLTEAADKLDISKCIALTKEKKC